ncbi:hypothetical protein PR048_021960 [Dryococelus australis]|uniref:Uncharacterized protein n=1 Tax=Dryococelus australis TaxID=614101 RepID=A0ABQ9GZR9_9NEOP|nr:hypothetical protein PR048_021960 [Dryococelus australis]
MRAVKQLRMLSFSLPTILFHSVRGASLSIVADCGHLSIISIHRHQRAHVEDPPYYATEASRSGSRREGWGSAEATEMVLNNLFFITAKEKETTDVCLDSSGAVSLAPDLLESSMTGVRWTPPTQAVARKAEKFPRPTPRHGRISRKPTLTLASTRRFAVAQARRHQGEQVAPLFGSHFKFRGLCELQRQMFEEMGATSDSDIGRSRVFAHRLRGRVGVASRMFGFSVASVDFGRNTRGEDSVSLTRRAGTDRELARVCPRPPPLLEITVTHAHDGFRILVQCRGYDQARWTFNVPDDLLRIVSESVSYDSRFPVRLVLLVVGRGCIIRGMKARERKYPEKNPVPRQCSWHTSRTRLRQENCLNLAHLRTRVSAVRCYQPFILERGLRSHEVSGTRGSVVPRLRRRKRHCARPAVHIFWEAPLGRGPGTPAERSHVRSTVELPSSAQLTDTHAHVTAAPPATRHSRVFALRGGGDGRSPRKRADQRHRPVTRPGIEPGSPWWEASVLIAQPTVDNRLTSNAMRLEPQTSTHITCGGILWPLYATPVWTSLCFVTDWNKVASSLEYLNVSTINDPACSGSDVSLALLVRGHGYSYSNWNVSGIVLPICPAQHWNVRNSETIDCRTGCKQFISYKRILANSFSRECLRQLRMFPPAPASVMLYTKLRAHASSCCFCLRRRARTRYLAVRVPRPHKSRTPHYEPESRNQGRLHHCDGNISLCAVVAIVFSPRDVGHEGPLQSCAFADLANWREGIKVSRLSQSYRRKHGTRDLPGLTPGLAAAPSAYKSPTVSSPVLLAPRTLLTLPLYLGLIVTNDIVLKRANETRILVETLNKRRNSFVCHLLRLSNWCTALFEGKLDGRRSRGRPRYHTGIDLRANHLRLFHVRKSVAGTDKIITQNYRRVASALTSGPGNLSLILGGFTASFSHAVYVLCITIDHGFSRRTPVPPPHFCTPSPFHLTVGLTSVWTPLCTFRRALLYPEFTAPDSRGPSSWILLYCQQDESGSLRQILRSDRSRNEDHIFVEQLKFCESPIGSHYDIEFGVPLLLRMISLARSRIFPRTPNHVGKGGGDGRNILKTITPRRALLPITETGTSTDWLIAVAALFCKSPRTLRVTTMAMTHYFARFNGIGKGKRCRPALCNNTVVYSRSSCYVSRIVDIVFIFGIRNVSIEARFFRHSQHMLEHVKPLLLHSQFLEQSPLHQQRTRCNRVGRTGLYGPCSTFQPHS